MESIIAECGEKERIEKIINKICEENKIVMTDQTRYELIEDIQENLSNIITNKVKISEIFSRVFPQEIIAKYNNQYILSKL